MLNPTSWSVFGRYVKQCSAIHSSWLCNVFRGLFEPCQHTANKTRDKNESACRPLSRNTHPESSPTTGSMSPRSSDKQIRSAGTIPRNATFLSCSPAFWAVDSSSFQSKAAVPPFYVTLATLKYKLDSFQAGCPASSPITAQLALQLMPAETNRDSKLTPLSVCVRIDLYIYTYSHPHAHTHTHTHTPQESHLEHADHFTLENHWYLQHVLHVWDVQIKGTTS